MNNILQRAFELKQQGASYQEIADRFNSEGIPTFSGSGKWDKRTIQRKLEQYEKDLKIGQSELTVRQLQEESEAMALQIEAYKREIAEKDAVIYGLNRTIEDLNTKLADSRPKNPNNFEGWTLTKASDGVYRLFKKFSGKNIGIYIGREFTPEIARHKIEETKARIKPGVVLMPLKRGRKPKVGKQESPSLPDIPFETRLRVLCPANRTYRLDTVRGAFPDMQHEDFDREMLALAGEQKIELTGGDPRECNPADLIKDGRILYVNFEWR